MYAEKPHWQGVKHRPVNIHYAIIPQTDKLYMKMSVIKVIKEYNKTQPINWTTSKWVHESLDISPPQLWSCTSVCLFCHSRWIERQATLSIYIQFSIHYSDIVDLILWKNLAETVQSVIIMSYDHNHNVRNSSVTALTVSLLQPTCSPVEEVPVSRLKSK